MKFNYLKTLLGAMLFLFLIANNTNAQNNALNFDGANDFVSIPHDAALKPATHVTVEAWIFATDISGIRDIIRKEDGDDRILFSFQNNGTILSFGLKVGGTQTELDVPITASDYLNRWVHIAAVYNGTQKIIYRNGVVIGTENVTGAIGTAGTAPLLLSSENGGFSFFNGSMDEFRFWNVARTQAQIQSGMTTELAGTETGLVVYYNFNKGVGGADNTALTLTVDDLATTLGGTNNGTLTNFALTGTTSNWVGGNANNALNFDHTGFPNRDFVSIPHNSNLDITGNLTLSAWVRPNSLNPSGFDNILLKGNYGYGFAIDFSNQLGYWSDGGYSNCPRFGTIVDNVWTHVAVVVVQGVSTTFYINGVQVGQTTNPLHTTINTGGASAVTTIGRQGSLDDNYFSGDMDEVMVWNTALNATQVNTAMNIGFLGNEAGLVAYYKFNHGVANASNTGVITLTDLAGGDNNGTLTNFTLSAGMVSNWVGGIALAPEINLQGNATTITDGDITPSTADHTNFVATLASTPIVRTFTIQNTGVRTLNISSISNTNTADFTVGTFPATIAAGSSATFTVTLNSATLGTKNATITINNDDTNESAYDFAITGRVINALPTSVRGNMLSLSGTNDVSVSNNAVFEFADGTLEFWVKPTYTSSPGYNPCMVSNRNNGGGASDTRYSYHMTGGKTAIELYNGTTVSTWSYTFNTNEWYYVSIVESGTTVEVFVNGISIGTRTTGSSAITGRVFNIGSSGNAERFQGQIEEVRVWNTARTQTQIRENMHLTLSGAESGLVSYYQFNETSGNAIDAVAGNNGTLQNGASRVASEVAVAQGTSNLRTITTGTMNFSSTGLAINFTTAPAGVDFVAYQLRGNPFNGVNQLNVGTNTPTCYWIVRQFGAGSVVYNRMDFTLPNSNTISSAPSTINLYKRPDNSTLAFPAPIASASNANNTTKFIRFSGLNETSFSQFEIGSTSSPLPITLLSFEGRRTDESNVLLQWKTATELNNKGFEIESSENGQNFQKIAFVDGAGNSTNIKNYQFNVQNSDDTYYRLKQIDFDGSFSYSNIIFIKGNENIVNIYPNPSNEIINIKTSKEGFVYEIFTLQGNSLIKSTATSNTANINIKSLPKGIYFVHIIQNNNRVVKKIVVE